MLAVAVSTVHIEPIRRPIASTWPGVRFTYPAINAAAMLLLLALAALGAAVLVVTVRAVWRQLRAHRRLVRALPVIGPLPGHPTVALIDVAAPLAFCAGWLRPRVYVSTGVLDRLSDERAARRPRARAAPPTRCATRCGWPSAACSARRCSSCRCCARCTTATAMSPS